MQFGFVNLSLLHIDHRCVLATLGRLQAVRARILATFGRLQAG
jgi:hypothetical protein